jgi:hypothetical protein
VIQTSIGNGGVAGSSTQIVGFGDRYAMQLHHNPVSVRPDVSPTARACLENTTSDVKGLGRVATRQVVGNERLERSSAVS